jgi:hypothetical protein
LRTLRRWPSASQEERKRALRNNHSSTLILDFQPPELEKNVSAFSHSVYGISLGHVETSLEVTQLTKLADKDFKVVIK